MRAGGDLKVPPRRRASRIVAATRAALSGVSVSAWLRRKPSPLLERRQTIFSSSGAFATSGPGGIHLLNGLYDAKLDGVPVLALTGMQHHDLITTHTQQDIELDKLFADVALYSTRVMSPSHTEAVMNIACRTALSYHGVAHVTMPVDIQSEKVDKKDFSERNVPGHSEAARAPRHSLPHNPESPATAGRPSCSCWTPTC